MTQTHQDCSQSVLTAMLSMQRHAWEQGMAMTAVRALGLDDVLYQMACDAVLRQHPDGRAALVGNENVATDPCCVGVPLLYIARKRKDPFLLNGFEKLLRWARFDAPRSERGLVYHFLNSREIWADSIYMLPPFLAAAGYADEAITMTDGYFDCLQDDSGLLIHRYDDASLTAVGPRHWGVGNGWALCALAALLPYADAKRDRPRLLSRLRSLLDTLLSRLRPDGLFHNIVDDPTSFTEVNLSQMCAFVLYTGFTQGWLPRSGDYLHAARIMSDAALKAVTPEGFVRPVCGAPRFNAPGIAPEGQAFFLLMYAAQSAFMQSYSELLIQ